MSHTTRRMNWFGFIHDGGRGPSSSGWMFVPGMDNIFPVSGVKRSAGCASPLSVTRGGKKKLCLQCCEKGARKKFFVVVKNLRGHFTSGLVRFDWASVALDILPFVSLHMFILSFASNVTQYITFAIVSL